MKSGKCAIVAGAGMGGLAAAAALAPRFEEVLVFDRDGLPDARTVRLGASQGGHVHALLRGGEMALDRLLPGIRDDFLREGAAVARIGLDYRIFEFGAWRAARDLGSTIACLTRPAYERALRRRVLALPNVTIESEARVARVLFEDGAATGVNLRRRKGAALRIAADFVVDARGRAAPLVRDLQDAGFAPPRREEIGIDVSYATARIRKPASLRDTADILGYLPTPPDASYALLFSVEEQCWVLTLAERGRNAPPKDFAELLHRLRALKAPEIAERVASGVLVEPIRSYRKLSAEWRRFDEAAVFPRRIVPLGDTIASFNPVYGQGMTVAARQALSLAETLDAQAADTDAFAPAYFAAMHEPTSDAWSVAAAIDFSHPETTGVRPPDLRMQQAMRFGLRWLADEDADVHRLALDVSQMARPLKDLKTIALAARALGVARRRGFSG